MVNAIKSDQSKLFPFKFRIYPTEEQKAHIKEVSDLYRFAYNWALEILFCNYLQISKETYKAYRMEGLSQITIYELYKDKPKGKFISFIDMCKIFRDFRNEHEWAKKMTVSTGRYAIRNVYSGYNKFFRHTVPHPPRFKKKGNQQTFACRGEKVHFRGDYVKIEGMQDPIYIGNNPHFPRTGKQKYNCTISYDGYENYYIAFTTELSHPIEFMPLEDEPIGIDLGMRNLATLSDGTIYKPLKMTKLEKRRRRAESKCAKDRNRRIAESKKARTKLEDIPISKRAQKRYVKFRKISAHIWNKRNTYVHQITREIVSRRPSAIVLEDLQARKIGKMFKEQGAKLDIREYLFRTFRNYIEYKAKLLDVPVIIAPKNYPSSQICSRCGASYHIGREKTYQCPSCGLTIDRDLNAALNLRSLASRS